MINLLNRIYKCLWLDKLKLNLLISFLITVVLVLGCQQPTTQPHQGCQLIDHSSGTTCIPNDWERLVALDSVSLEDAMALEIVPIGAVTSNLSSFLAEKLAKVTNIGKQGEPSLEGILRLKPDLVIGIDAYQNLYRQLQQIAPSLLFTFEHSGKWKEIFLEIAQVLGKTDKAHQVLKSYEARLAQFQEQMGDRLNQIQVSVIRIYPEQISIYLRESFPGTILEDAGLLRPSFQDLGVKEAMAIAHNPIQMFISPELLHYADGDVIFVWTAENESEINQNAQTKFRELQESPLWQQLNAVKRGQVYQVPDYWIGSGPLAANLVIDDLFKYLTTNRV